MAKKLTTFGGFGVVMGLIFWVYPSIVWHGYNPFLIVLAALIYGIVCGWIFDRIYNHFLPSLKVPSSRLGVLILIMVIIAGLAYLARVVVS